MTTDFATAETDARSRIAELHERRQHLALEASNDTNAAAQLADVEAELAELGLELERAELARAEQQRRDEEAAAAAAAASRAEALGWARDVLARRQKAAGRIDTALAGFAKALAELAALEREQLQALKAAGERELLDDLGYSQKLKARLAEAIARAFLDADVPSGLLDVPHRRVSSRPLAINDPVAERWQGGGTT